jgi:hypothetical protein
LPEADVDVNRYSKIRPYLYHLTDRLNLDQIRESKVLFCAAELMKRAGCSDLLRTRRQDHESIEVNGSTISLRDQKPLLSGNMELTGDFTRSVRVRIISRAISVNVPQCCDAGSNR